MAKKEKKEKVGVSGRGRRAAMITLGDGTEVPRNDYVRKLFQEDGMSNSEIVKHLNELGYETQYIAVQMATKTTDRALAARAARAAKKADKASEAEASE